MIPTNSSGLSGLDVKRNMGNAKPMPIYGEEVLGKIGHQFMAL
jgi:hypothetical protein